MNNIEEAKWLKRNQCPICKAQLRKHERKFGNLEEEVLYCVNHDKAWGFCGDWFYEIEEEKEKAQVKMPFTRALQEMRRSWIAQYFQTSPFLEWLEKSRKEKEERTAKVDVRIPLVFAKKEEEE